MKLRVRSLMCLAGLVTGFSAQAAFAQDPEHGIEVSVFGSTFFGGESGPTVPAAAIHPETGYEDTFDSGFGITAQYFRHFSPYLRWQAGLVHKNWPGEFFEGGEFQAGWEFGAGGQFDDLTITGLYGGLTFIRQAGTGLRPFASIDLAIVNISELNVLVSGTVQPYWENAFKDFVIIKGGVAYEASPAVSIIFHAGFSVLGSPKNAGLFTSATAGSSLVAGLGASYAF